jgi:hypothetical protein
VENSTMVFIIPTTMMIIVANSVGDCSSQGPRPKVAVCPAVKSRNHLPSRRTPPFFSFLCSTSSPSDFLPFDFSFSFPPPPLNACGYRGMGCTRRNAPAEPSHMSPPSAVGICTCRLSAFPLHTWTRDGRGRQQRRRARQEQS